MGLQIRQDKKNRIKVSLFPTVEALARGVLRPCKQIFSQGNSPMCKLGVVKRVSLVSNVHFFWRYSLLRVLTEKFLADPGSERKSTDLGVGGLSGPTATVSVLRYTVALHSVALRFAGFGGVS